MRGKHVLIGILWYIAGASALLVMLLVLRGGQGLFHVVDGADWLVLVAGAIALSVGAMILQRFEYRRPSPAERGEGARPRKATSWLSEEGHLWSSISAIVGAAVAFSISPPAAAGEDDVLPARGTFESLVIDGDRDGIAVVFVHEHANEHIGRHHKGRPCGRCHHLNLPGEEATPCSECHRSRVKGRRTDIFDHDRHAEYLTRQHGGNMGCLSCHPLEDTNVERRRANVIECIECHATRGSHEDAPAALPMAPEGFTTKMGEGADQGMARSYVEALHGQCRGCHQEEITDAGTRDERTRCLNCHPAGEVLDDSR